MLSSEIKAYLHHFADSERMRMVLLTGAGVSAESGIPTFRGPEGYWQAGSVNYTPQQIGTLKMFRQSPKEVWKWYLFRKTVCDQAKPNAGHEAVAKMEKMLGSTRFTLATQNVDGLHLRAGNTMRNTLLIHGDLTRVRCSRPCRSETMPFPEGIAPKTRESEISDEEWELLKCPHCGALTRPHILWFDEQYNQEYYQYETALNRTRNADLLIIVGTSGATNLPFSMYNAALGEDAKVMVINLDENLFTRSLRLQGGGFIVMGKSGEILPEVARVIDESV